MSRRERDKGLCGEREVAALYAARGLEPRGLEGAGDHLIVCDPSSGITIHSEVKRHETARPWAWHEQARSEAPAGTIPVVHFRRNASPWLCLLELEHLLDLIDAARRGGGGER